MSRYANFCRCCGRLADEHPVTVGYDSVCAIFMAFDWLDYSNMRIKRVGKT